MTRNLSKVTAESQLSALSSFISFLTYVFFFFSYYSRNHVVANHNAATDFSSVMSCTSEREKSLQLWSTTNSIIVLDVIVQCVYPWLVRYDSLKPNSDRL